MSTKPWKIGTSYAVAFSGDGRLLATLGRDVSIWDLALRSKVVRAHPFSHPSDAAFSPDQRHLAVRSTSGQIAIVDVRSGLTVVDFDNAAEGEGSNLQYSPCGEFIADGTWSGRLSVRRASSGLTSLFRIIRAKASVAFTGLTTASTGSSHTLPRQRLMIARLRPIISPFGAGRLARDDIASCPSVLRSRNHRHSPLTVPCWPSSMVRRQTRCRYFG